MITDKRIIAVVGHYGSGKTEFSVSLIHDLAESGVRKLAICDLDIANPYFRSRERKQELNDLGVAVYGSHYGTEITAELPAIDAGIKAPLEDRDTTVVVDVGGDDSGARIMHQFMKYFKSDDCELICIVNKNRPETSTPEGAENHIRRIEAETGLTVTGLVSNAHFIRYTTAQDVFDGWEFTSKLAEKLGKPLLAATAPEHLMGEVRTLQKEKGVEFELFRVGMYMRESWLDKKV